MDTARMTSIRHFIVAVLHDATQDWDDPLGDDGEGERLADALLANPNLRAIVDLAAWYQEEGGIPFADPPEVPHEVVVALLEWRGV